MNNLKIFLFLIPLLVPFQVVSVNAPVSRIPDTTACPGSVITLPVRVTGFQNVASVSLKFLYNTSNLTFVSWSNVSGFPGLNLNASLPGTIVVSGFTFSPGGITLASNAIFFSVTFNYSGGSSAITWFDNGSSCEFVGPPPTFAVMNDIPTSQYYINGGIAPSLKSEFSASELYPGVQDTVIFQDLSTGAPTAWSWSFLPATYSFTDGTSASNQNPHVAFLTNGPYTAVLTVTNSSCSASKTRTDYIHVGINGLWTGEFSELWNNPANWHNWSVPDAAISVVIPPWAPHWPLYDGNFTIGVQCLNLTIEGPAGEITINGDLIIPE